MHTHTHTNTQHTLYTYTCIHIHTHTFKHTDLLTEDEVKAFFAESLVMKDFSHAHILGLLGVCFDTPDSCPYIVMPFMTNGNMKSFLKSKRVHVIDVDTYPEVCVRQAWSTFGLQLLQYCVTTRSVSCISKCCCHSNTSEYWYLHVVGWWHASSLTFSSIPSKNTNNKCEEMLILFWSRVWSCKSWFRCALI